MSSRRLNRTAVADAACEVVDDDGFDSLSLTAVADSLDVSPPALYSHVDNADELRTLVAASSLRSLTQALQKSAIAQAPPAAFSSLAHAYRDFAAGNPGRFDSMLTPPLGEEAELKEANGGVLEVFRLVFDAGGLEEREAHLAARAARSAIHGFVSLEHLTGSTDAHAEEFRYLIDALAAGVGLASR